MATKHRRPGPPPRYRRVWDPGGSDEEAERRLFLEEMTRLDAVPDKDGASAASGPRPPHRLKIPRSKVLHPDDRLDLHGLTAEIARATLDRFMAQARRHRLAMVLVVTGKGHGSPGRVGVLKTELERWVLAEGAEHVRAFAEAPRPLGGTGAYILYLR